MSLDRLTVTANCQFLSEAFRPTNPVCLGRLSSNSPDGEVDRVYW